MTDDGKARFDEAFFERYYGDPETRVADDSDAERLAALIAGIVDYTEIRVRRILDAGCGVGLLRAPLLARFPQATYTGLEYSEFLCRKFGWEQGSLADFESRTPFDLVVCHDVLQYLDDREAAQAITNLAKWCRGALYLEALTSLDWRQNVDRSRTDGNVHLRSGAWYRAQLDKHFKACGGGVFCSRRAGVALFELEST